MKRRWMRLTGHTIAGYLRMAVMLCLMTGMMLAATTVFADEPLSLNKSKMTMYVGTKKKLKATGKDETAKWTSSKPTVARVSKWGTVTAKNAGKTKITLTCSGKSVSCIVTVKNPTIILNKTNLEIKTGYKEQLKATVKGPSKEVAWTSTKKSVATVSDTGMVTPKKAGTATIKASANGVTATCKVKVIYVPPVKLNLNAITLKSGQSRQLKASAPELDLPFAWKSSDETVASVKYGKVTGKNPGTAVITVYCGTTKATCSVTVKENPNVKKAYLQFLKDHYSQFTENGQPVFYTMYDVDQSGVPELLVAYSKSPWDNKMVYTYIGGKVIDAKLGISASAQSSLPNGWAGSMLYVMSGKNRIMVSERQNAYDTKYYVYKKKGRKLSLYYTLYKGYKNWSSETLIYERNGETITKAKFNWYMKQYSILPDYGNTGSPFIKFVP